MKWQKEKFKLKGQMLWTFALLMSLTISSCTWKSGSRGVADDDSSGQKSAFQIYSELQEAATTFNTKAIMVNGDLAIDGMDAGVTWGAEKEASSSLVTRVMSPDKQTFRSWVMSLGEAEREAFLRDFMSNYIKNANGYRTYRTKDGRVLDLATDVIDLEGNVKQIDVSVLRGIDYATATIEQVTEKFDAWLEMTDDRPLTFVKPSTRMKMFNGTLPGLTQSTGINPRKNRSAPNYGSWKAIFGQAEKYVDNAHGHGGGQGGGWEINFHAQKTYGEFEEMVIWFRTELENAGRLFQAPGHQRMVFRKHPDLQTAKLGEVYKAIQALIVVDGIKGKTGIEKANHKSVHADADLASLSTGRGVIRLEGDRFGPNTLGVEFRAGTKDIRLARFYQTALASRVATNDFSGIADVGSWTLVPNSGGWSVSFEASELASRFGVEQPVVERAMQKLQAAGIKQSYTIPFWNWIDENNPFLSGPKRSLIKSLTQDFIKQAAELPDSNIEQTARELMRSWTKSTRLSEELRDYITPRRGLDVATDLLHFNPPSGRPLVSNVVDVNNIDLGIEYSGKLPLKLDADFTEERLADNKRAWLTTKVDLTTEERENLLKKVAKDLLEELGGEGEPVRVESPGGHGHGLELSFTITDQQGRKWAVEWDGVGRSYSPSGDVLQNSPRAGSLELVTPKFTPSIEEMDAVYRAFEKNSIMPSLLAGGGHINVDLAAFDGKPRQLARFISIFHEHRGVIALMFQHVNRMKSGEPLDISDTLRNSLRDFNGSETDLKKLLYNEQYFNTRYGRKSRYAQLELSAYYQDVIPEEFLTSDFDIQSPAVPWRRQFRVDPNIRKAEFRLFNAPRDAAESALQIRLVRAMLSKALNEDDDLSGAVQKVDHQAYLNSPDKAYADLKKMCDHLGLNIDDYRPAVAEGLSETDIATRSVFFEGLAEKLQMHPKQPGWGRAVEPRQTPMASEGREWTPGAADQQNTMSNEHRVRAAAEAERRRSNIVPDRIDPGSFRRTDSCIDAIAPFI